MSTIAIKKVRFATKTTIIILDNYEDRKGPWETMALDRFRFNQRIRQVETKIQWCLEPLHRERALQRFN